AREDLVLSFLADEQNSILAKLKSDYADVPSEKTLQRMDQLAGLISRRTEQSKQLRVYLIGRRNEVALKQMLSEFQELSDAAMKTLKTEDLKKARQKWEFILSAWPPDTHPVLWSSHGDKDGRPALWENHVLRARSASILRTNESAGNSELSLPGQLLSSGPPVLPVYEYAALVRTTVQSAADPDRPLFVRIDDLCWVLSQNGNPLIVWRTGYDFHSLPQVMNSKGGQCIAMLWDDAGIQCLSVLTESLTPQWTWRLPSELSFSGAPKLIHNLVTVALTDGRVWQLDSQSGHPEFRCPLPGPLTSPVFDTEDHTGGIITGEDSTIYFLKFADGQAPLLDDIVYPQSGSNTVSTECIWIPPFAVLFENDVTDSCRMIVLEKKPPVGDNPSEFEEVDRRVLEGHVLQPPSVRGTHFLVATDAGEVSTFGLSLRNDERVYEISDQSLDIDRIERPHFGSHPRAGFVVASRNLLHNYRVNPLAPAHSAVSRAWSFKSSSEDASPVQSLQISNTQVAAAFRSPGRSAVRLVNLRVENGERLWVTELGSTVVQWNKRRAAAGKPQQISTVSSTGEFFQISLIPEGVRSFRSGYAEINSSLTFSDDGFFVCWVDDQGPSLEYSTVHGYRTRSVPLVFPAVSPVALRKVASAAANEDTRPGSSGIPGIQAAFIDTNRALQIVTITHQDISVNCPVLANVPSEGWLRPVWKSDSSLLAAHSDGLLLHLNIDLVSGVYFVRETARQQFATPFAFPPLLANDAVVVTNVNSTIAVLDAETLEEQMRFAAPGATTAPVAVENSVFMGDSRGDVLKFDLKQTLRPENQQEVVRLELGQRPIEHLSVSDDEQRIVAADTDGVIYVVETDDGQVSAFPSKGRLVLPPLVVGESVVTALCDGSVHRISPVSDSQP
ncbi:MAG: hypothetical protein ABGZ35_22825, partial [Planctomycetaceae bacterium]